MVQVYQLCTNQVKMYKYKYTRFQPILISIDVCFPIDITTRHLTVQSLLINPLRSLYGKMHIFKSLTNLIEIKPKYNAVSIRNLTTPHKMSIRIDHIIYLFHEKIIIMDSA